MTETVLINEPTPGQRIERLHAWIGIHASGDEGILSADLIIPMLGPRHLPIMTSRESGHERLWELARAIEARSQETDNPIVRIEMRTFVRP